MKAARPLFFVLFLAAPAAAAQEITPLEPIELERTRGFVEATGAWSYNIGRTEYIPEADGDFQHPLVNGYSVGGTVGAAVGHEIYVVGNYEYTRSDTRDGAVMNAVDDIEGEISYHTATVGVRIGRKIGAGVFFGEVGAGLIFPFKTKLELEYSPALAMAGITGTGRRTEDFNAGPGAYGALSYRWRLGQNLYLGPTFRVRAFQSHNNGEQTRFENFVDLTAEGPPEVINATIEHSDDPGSMAPPMTYSVQDARLQIALGFAF